MSNIFTPSTWSVPASQRGELAWEVAMLFPPQGHWTEAEYLALDTNHLVELVDGCIEVHPMASAAHPLILKYLLYWLDQFVIQHRLGVVLFAPFPVRLFPGTCREPDIVYLKPGRLQDAQARLVVGADLVVEVVSEGTANRKRDLVTKPTEYAAANIAEYWLVDPELQQITVLTLDGTAYREHGVFRIGDVATSRLLPGLTLSVQETFAAAEAAR